MDGVEDDYPDGVEDGCWDGFDDGDAVGNGFRVPGIIIEEDCPLYRKHRPRAAHYLCLYAAGWMVISKYELLAGWMDG